jgi:hypothetical protein
LNDEPAVFGETLFNVAGGQHRVREQERRQV